MRKLQTESKDTTVVVLDEPGAGGACHEYTVLSGNFKHAFANIKFQKGPIQEAGVNGCQMEDLLAIVRDRLEGFQAGEFACEENARALDHVKKAVVAPNMRTEQRRRQGVEGTDQRRVYSNGCTC